MDDAVLREPYREPPGEPPHAGRVRIEGGQEQTFTAPFTIGRGGEATLQVEAGSLDIYTRLAEASDLLAMASYNWGKGCVIPRLPRLEGLIDEQQADPFDGIPHIRQQRKYGHFLNEYGDRMPDQTKDYVLYIVGAAVIGQNPCLFGVDFDDPQAPYLDASMAPAASL